MRESAVQRQPRAFLGQDTPNASGSRFFCQEGEKNMDFSSMKQKEKTKTVVTNTKRSSPAAYLFLLLLLLLCNRRGERRTDGQTENARIGNVSGHFFYDALLQTVEQPHQHCDKNNGIRTTGPWHRISVFIAKDGLNRGVSLSTNSREYRDDCAHVRCDASPAAFSWAARF